jgi:transitional endoplasmic reticulum ATPase
VSVIFFDEFEGLARKRDEDSHPNVNIVQEILAHMQGVEESKNILLVMAATNCPERIDSAFLRPGRFDEQIYIGLPNDDDKIKLLKNGLKQIKQNHIEYKSILPFIKYYSCADLDYVVDKIKRLAIDYDINNNQDFVLTNRILKEKILQTPSTVNIEDLRKIENYAMQHNQNVQKI